MAKPLTLYHISYKQQRDKKEKNILIFVPIDTAAIPFSKELSDTLFILTKDFLRRVEFNNSDTIGQTSPVITDDSQANVELSYSGRKLSATISSINNPTIATKQFDTLLNFIEKFSSPKRE